MSKEWARAHKSAVQDEESIVQRQSEARVAKADAETSSQRVLSENGAEDEQAKARAALTTDRVDTGSFDLAALQLRPSWASDNDGPSVSAAPASVAIAPTATAPVAPETALIAPAIARVEAAANAPVQVTPATVVAGSSSEGAHLAPSVAVAPLGGPANIVANATQQPPVAVVSAVAPAVAAALPAASLVAGPSGASTSGTVVNGAAKTLANGAAQPRAPVAAAPATAVRPVTFSAAPRATQQVDEDDYVLPASPNRGLYIAGGVGALALILLVMMFSGSNEKPAAVASRTETGAASLQEAAPPSRVVAPSSSNSVQGVTPSPAPVPTANAPTPQAIPIVTPPAPPVAPAVEEEPSALKATKVPAKRKRERTVSPTRTTKAPSVRAAQATKPAVTRSRTTSTAKPKRGAGLVNTNPY